MRKIRGGYVLGLTASILAVGILVANAQQHVETGSGIVSGEITGDYSFYSGPQCCLSGAAPDDARIDLRMRGKMAADMYRYMGRPAQLKETCGVFDRREKGDLACKRNRKTGATFCSIKVNLLTGEANKELGC